MKNLVLNKEKLDIERVYELIEESYNMSLLTETFCKKYSDIEEIRNITTGVKFIHQYLDKAYALLIDTMIDTSDAL